MARLSDIEQSLPEAAMRYTDAPERRAELLRLAATDGYLSSAEAARRLGVSEMTVRRDLGLLEEEGEVRRVAGGATLVSSAPFERRDAVETVRKRAIARAAADEIAAAQTVALDAGTTVAAVLPFLGERTVVTHSLPVIEALTRRPAPLLIAAGGHYQPDTRSFAGPLAEETMRSVRCDLAVLSATALDPEGLWGTNVLDAAIKRVLAQQSARVILLADSTKLARTAPVRIAAWEAVDLVITDAGVDPAALAALERTVAVRIAP
jgi:DeoR/GlpR family transcriptional regulator of sugar metabolism